LEMKFVLYIGYTDVEVLEIPQRIPR